DDRGIIRVTPDLKYDYVVPNRKTGSVIRTLAVGPDGRLHYVGTDGKVVRVEGQDRETVLATLPGASHLAVARDGTVYCTVPKEDGVYRVADVKGPPAASKVADKVPSPTGLVFWADGGTLVVGSATAPSLWAFRVHKDGSLDAGERYYPIRTRPKQPSGTAGLTIDRDGRLYAATSLGVQVFDPTGRMSGVLLPANPGKPTTEVYFGGTDLGRLYCVCGDQLYVRLTKAKG